MIEHSQKSILFSTSANLFSICSSFLLFYFLINIVFLGAADRGPYNAIHVGAAAATMPQDLVDQLADNGRMVIPVITQLINKQIL